VIKGLGKIKQLNDIMELMEKNPKIKIPHFTFHPYFCNKPFIS